jgi:hypothetical protein
MADIKFTFTGDTTNLDKSVQDAIESINRMGKEAGSSANEINKAFNKLGKDLVKSAGADKALASIKQNMAAQKAEIEKLTPRWSQLNKAMDEMKGKEITAEQYKQIAEFQELEQTLASLNESYAQYEEVLAGAEKQSKMFSVAVGDMVYEGTSARNVQMQMYNELKRLAAAGKEQTDEFRALQKAYANLSDMSSDLAQANRALASDTAKLDAALGGLQAAAGAYSALTGTLEAFGVSGENAEESQKRLQSAIAITTGLQSVANQFQKQSAVMQGIMLMQDKARAKALDMLAASQGKATIAQRIFNAVAKANPYVLLATALVTVVGALAAFAFGSGNAAKQEAKAAAGAKAWADGLKTVLDNEAMLSEKRQQAAKHAVDMANAEGKSKREVLELQKQQLEVEKELADAAMYAKVGNDKVKVQWVDELDKNKQDLADLRKKLSDANSRKARGDKWSEDGKKLNDDYFNALNDRISAMETLVEQGEKVVEMNRQVEISEANLAEQTRQLAIEEANANTQARRTTEDMRAELMTDEKAKQRKQTAATYDRQIEDLKTRLANEKNLTVEQREEMNKQIILLDQQKKKALEDLRRQDLNDQYNAQKEVQAKMRELTVERMEQETNDTLKALQEKAQVEKQARLDELEEQKQAWIKAQGGLKDSEGKYSDESKLTKEQKEYLQSAAKNINDIFGDGTKVLGSMIEKEIYDKYSSAFQRAVKDNKRFEDDIALMAGAGKDTSEAERQRNEQALAYMQDVEGGLTPEFKAWIDSLGDMTLKTLESELKKAEESLTALKAKNASTEEIMAAEARIAALNKEVKEAQTDIQRGPKLTAYKNLNKVLGDAASGFEALGQTGNEAFDSLMKNIADITNTVQTVVANIQTLVQSSIEGMKDSAEAGASAVKTVEKASVILAIIGAVIQLTMKLAQLVDDSNLSRMPEIRKDVEKLRESLRDLKREMALDVSDNDTIFGDNQLKNLQQYTKAFNDYVQTYTEGVDKMAMSGYDEERKRHLATAIGNDTKDFMNRQFDRALADVKKEGYSLADAVNQMLDTTQIKTRDGGLFRSAKYESLRSVLGEDANKIIGATEKETIKNLKTLIDTQSQLKDEQKATIEDMIRDWETYNEALEGVKGYFNDFFGGMTDSFAEAIKVGLTDGVKEGKQNFKEAVLDMVTDMYISKTIGEQFSKALEDAGKQVESIQTNESLSPEEKLKQQTDVIADTANTLVDGFDQSLSVVEAVRDRVRDKIGMGAGELDGTLSGAIKGASQESIDLLSGYCNAVRIQQVDGINIMREQLISLSGIEGNTRAINVGLQGFRTSMENILRTDGARAVGAN